MRLWPSCKTLQPKLSCVFFLCHNYGPPASDSTVMARLRHGAPTGDIEGPCCRNIFNQYIASWFGSEDNICIPK